MARHGSIRGNGKYEEAVRGITYAKYCSYRSGWAL